MSWLGGVLLDAVIDAKQHSTAEHETVSLKAPFMMMWGLQSWSDEISRLESSTT